MVIDDRRDHSFRVPRPDLTVEFGTPNTCNDCHTRSEESPEWAAAKVREWYGDVWRDDPHWTPALAAGRRGTPGGDALLADVILRPTTPAIVRATAVSLIGQYPTEKSVQTQHAALRDSDPLVRTAAVRVLSGGNSQEEIVRLLGERLSDPIRAVRVAAVQRLAPLGREKLPQELRVSFDRALEEFRNVQQLTLERAHSHINLAWLERQLGKADTSMEHLCSAIWLEPYLTGPRTDLANLLAGGNGDDAEISALRREEAERLERDTALLPDGADIFYRLGLVRFQLGEYDAAAAAFERACELMPANYQYRMALALLEERRYELDGDPAPYEAAIQSLNKLREIQPDAPQTEQILQRLRSTKSQLGGIHLINPSEPSR
jgi:hypothetical protein